MHALSFDQSQVLGGNRVLMLVNNPCINDSRVIKSAEALAQGGWSVTVICRHVEERPATESRNGVTYERVKLIPASTGSIKKLLRAVAAWCSHKLRVTRLPTHRSLTRCRKTCFKHCHHRIGAYLRLGQRKLKNEDIRGIGLALGIFVLVAWPLLQTVYKQVRRPFIVYGKPCLRQLRRPFIIYGKPFVRRLRRGVWLRIRPFVTVVFGFLETDEFGSAAVERAKSLQPDVVHAHDLSTLPAGGRIVRAVDARFIYDSHELEMHRNATYKRLVKWRRQRLERKYIRKADAVITVSDSIADHLRDTYRIKRPRVIMNSPRLEDTKGRSRELRSELSLKKEAPLAVYVGSVTINRGLEQTVRALVHAPAVHFAAVGPRRQETEQGLIDIARELDVLDRIHFVDPVAPNEVVDYIRGADVSVLPIQNVCLSYYYCMPNKLLESVFAGIPVAVANLLEMRRFVERHGCGVIMDETNPRAIAKAVLEVIDAREAFVLSAEQRRRLASEYEWQRQAEKLCDLYGSLVEPKVLAAKAA